MGSLGVTVTFMQPFLTPLTFVLLLITLAGLYRGYKLNSDSTPLILGVVGIALLLSGIYWLDYPKVTFAGVGLLIGASLWNIWPKWDLDQA
jgi:ABC-type nickel/cobalt efflux system permease component RcnA